MRRQTLLASTIRIWALIAFAAFEERPADGAGQSAASGYIDAAADVDGDGIEEIFG